MAQGSGMNAGQYVLVVFIVFIASLFYKPKDSPESGHPKSAVVQPAKPAPAIDSKVTGTPKTVAQQPQPATSTPPPAEAPRNGAESLIFAIEQLVVTLFTKPSTCREPAGFLEHVYYFGRWGGVILAFPVYLFVVYVAFWISRAVYYIVSGNWAALTDPSYRSADRRFTAWGLAVLVSTPLFFIGQLFALGAYGQLYIYLTCLA
jgi:hypothetical protein